MSFKRTGRIFHEDWWITSDGSTYLPTSNYGTSSVQTSPASHPSSSPTQPAQQHTTSTPTGTPISGSSPTSGAPSTGGLGVSTVVTSLPVTITSGSSTFTSFSSTTFTTTPAGSASNPNLTSASVTSTSGSTISTSSTMSTFTTTSSGVASTRSSAPDSGQLANGSQPVCIGNGLDVYALGIIECVVLPTVVGLVLWVLFAIIRPRFRQVYAVREWFAPQDRRPPPLRDSLWAFLFPRVPLVPSLPTGNTEKEGETFNDYPSDGQLSQRVLWISFLIALGWSIVGLAGALPLYLVNTPCLQQSAVPSTLGGFYSTLQDLSLLRLLQLFDDGNVQTTGSLQRSIIFNGKDITSNLRIRLIILTVFVLVLALLPALYKILKEFRLLAKYRRRWLEVRCGGVEMGWLSAAAAPGFVGWGEKRVKDYMVKTGLSESLEKSGGGGTGSGLAGIGSGLRGKTLRQREEERYPMNAEEKGKLEVDIQSLFSISDNQLLALLIDERDKILNNLEIAETRYISSFRLSSPEPSVNEFPIPLEDQNDIKRHISRPKALAGAATRRDRRGRTRPTDTSGAPTSYVAPSQYYKLRHVQGISGGRMSSESTDDHPTFGDTVRSRVVGTRFQEVNRDSTAYGRLPLGQKVAVDRVGGFSPVSRPPRAINPRFGPNHILEQSSSGNEADTEGFPYVGTSSGPSGTQDTSTPLRGVSAFSTESPAPFYMGHDGGTTVRGTSGYSYDAPALMFVDPPAPGTVSSNVEKEEMGVIPRPRTAEAAPAERRETFAMRSNGDEQSGPLLPPHLRLQPQQPFVRPVSGMDHDDLGAVYADIGEWRSRLKAINNEIVDAQNDCYNDIADGMRIKGWLITGRGVRFLPGIQMIDGRCKEDIRWDELQRGGGKSNKLVFWLVVVMAALFLGAGLTAVSGLTLTTAPGVTHFLTFLRPLLRDNDLATGLAITLAPAAAATLFIVIALAVVHYASHFDGSVAISTSQLRAYKATFLILTVIATMWLIAVGSVIFSLESFDAGSGQSKSVANGSIYMSAFLLAIMLSVAVISPALLLLQPRRLLRVLRQERQAITPRQRFRAVYPRIYDPSYATGCCVLALVFASTFALIFPLIGPAVTILLFLTLIAQRFLVGYVYGRTNAQSGGTSQLWLLRRFGTILTFQPILLGLIFFTRHLWVEAGVLIGVAFCVIITVEIHTNSLISLPGVKTLSNITRDSLDTFTRTALPNKHRSVDEEGTSLVSSQPVRTRRSIASVLEMMSVTLAVMPSPHQTRGPVPLETEALDDLTATERAARTHPDAPPHLPPLPFTDHAEEMSGILYAPELIAPPPTIWLPNDSSGIARSEAYDLQRYHNLRTTLDVRSTDDILPQRSSSSRAHHHSS